MLWTQMRCNRFAEAGHAYKPQYDYKIRGRIVEGIADVCVP